MASPMSKSKIVAHLAEKLEVPKKKVAEFFDELFKLRRSKKRRAPANSSFPDWAGR